MFFDAIPEAQASLIYVYVQRETVTVTDTALLAVRNEQITSVS